VHHLADSEMTSAIRLRRILALDRPAIEAYDRPIGASLEAFRFACATTAELLDRLDDAAWPRSGAHPEHDRDTIDDWLTLYAAHAHDHADQIRHARASAAR
jgi:hypothetical protein